MEDSVGGGAQMNEEGRSTRKRPPAGPTPVRCGFSSFFFSFFNPPPPPRMVALRWANLFIILIIFVGLAASD